MPRAPARPWVATNEHTRIRMLARLHRETGRHTTQQFPFLPLRNSTRRRATQSHLPGGSASVCSEKTPHPLITTPVIRMIRMVGINSPPHFLAALHHAQEPLFRSEIIQKSKIKVCVLLNPPTQHPRVPLSEAAYTTASVRRRAVKLN